MVDTLYHISIGCFAIASYIFIPQRAKDILIAAFLAIAHDIWHGLWAIGYAYCRLLYAVASLDGPFNRLLLGAAATDHCSEAEPGVSTPEVMSYRLRSVGHYESGIAAARKEACIRQEARVDERLRQEQQRGVKQETGIKQEVGVWGIPALAQETDVKMEAANPQMVTSRCQAFTKNGVPCKKTVKVNIGTCVQAPRCPMHRPKS